MQTTAEKVDTRQYSAKQTSLGEAVIDLSGGLGLVLSRPNSENGITSERHSEPALSTGKDGNRYEARIKCLTYGESYSPSEVLYVTVHRIPKEMQQAGDNGSNLSTESELAAELVYTTHVPDGEKGVINLLTDTLSPEQKRTPFPIDCPHNEGGLQMIQKRLNEFGFSTRN